MSKLIETPYGKKSPELLCRAMDALELLPELTATLEKALPKIATWITEDEHARAKALIAKAKACDNG